MPSNSDALAIYTPYFTEVEHRDLQAVPHDA